MKQKINDLFDIQNSMSKGYEKHEKGVVPFISNGLYNNGILGFVTPLKGERIFKEDAICVSSFCEATVQKAPFLPRGNGGSGLVVLIPKTKMMLDELYAYAAQINRQRWRFSFGRMVIGERIKNVLLNQDKIKFSIQESIEKLLPKDKKSMKVKIKKLFDFPLDSLCEIKREYSSYLNKLDVSKKKTPYVTTTEMNNGVALYCNEKPIFKKGTLTVSLDGLCGTTFYQFDDFLSGEKTAVLELKGKKNPYLLLYIASLIRRKSWRYHYGRKLSMERLKKMNIPLPTTNKGEIDDRTVQKIVNDAYGSEIFDKYL